MTPEKVEQVYQAILANTIPGEKDMSADQAAAYAAGIIMKAYDVDLSGYRAEAVFSRNSVPNSDTWQVIFDAPNETNAAIRYCASLNSVNGTMLSLSAYNLDYGRETHSTNLDDPAWKNAAEQDVTKLLPSNVSITNSKVVSANSAGGVMVVCNLSDGSAYGVRLTGENKEAAVYQYFPSGYDGSWEKYQAQPAAGNAVC
jgi:hypothetical protein